MADGRVVSKVAALSYGGKVYLQSEAIDAALRTAKIPFTQKGNDLSVGSDKQNPSSAPTPSSETDQYGLSYSNLAISVDATVGSTTVDGEVTNHSKKSFSAIIITVSFFNKEGKLLGTADGSVMGLGPGKTKTFEAASFTAYSNAAKAVCQTSMAG